MRSDTGATIGQLSGSESDTDFEPGISVASRRPMVRKRTITKSSDEKNKSISAPAGSEWLSTKCPSTSFARFSTKAKRYSNPMIRSKTQTQRRVVRHIRKVRRQIARRLSSISTCWTAMKKDRQQLHWRIMPSGDGRRVCAGLGWSRPVSSRPSLGGGWLRAGSRCRQ